MDRCRQRLGLVSNHLAHVPKHTWFRSDGWGFRDSKFDLNNQNQLVLLGNRYEDSGKVFPHFTKWIEQYGLDITSRTKPQKKIPIDPPRENPQFIEKVKIFCTHITQDHEERSFHSHGHTLQEMCAVKFGKIDRAVDLVVYPGCENDVQGIMSLAGEYNVLLVPFGGGTNVTHALMLDPKEDRFICSVDMSKMNHILQVNLTSMTATVEAGIAGRDLEKELAKYGVCCGHEPDSVEFSTLGGWISTRASGMKKNVYGNIEDIVLTVRIVTPIGTWEKPCGAPRMSTGPDTNHFVLGHEGLFGVITQATIKIKFIPEEKDFDSILFPNYEIGAKFMYECGIRLIRPASIRLVDNEQFKFAMALKPDEASGFKGFVDSAKKIYVTKIKGYDPEQMCVCTLVFEGSKEQVFLQKKQIFNLANKYQGLRAGPENGKRGYFLTFTIAYIRDFGMEFHLYAESFEASVPWEHLTKFLKNVPSAIKQACADRGIQKRPFVSSRITQIYDTGCCVYVYFGFITKDLPDPLKIYSEIEDLAREEIMKNGGSLSHHHGVGKLRKGFMNKACGETSMTLLRGIQQVLDPKRIMANSNLI